MANPAISFTIGEKRLLISSLLAPGETVAVPCTWATTDGTKVSISAAGPLESITVSAVAAGTATVTATGPNAQTFGIDFTVTGPASPIVVDCKPA